MNNQWSLDSHGDPLGTVRDFIKGMWLESGLDGMLVTVSGENESTSVPQYITEVEEVEKINPFKPLMEINIARMIPGLIASHPNARIGTVMRPCEMRALTEMTKHEAFDTGNLLTVSVDCLGTLPADEYQWRLERAEKAHPDEESKTAEPTDELAQEALKFARQGGIIPYRYRSACQVCTSPSARNADINVHILGLPVRQHMLVSAKEPVGETQAHIEKLVNGRASKELIQQHERMMAKMSERHQRTMYRLNEGLGGLLPVDVDAVIHLLESCGECEKCLEVCPICSVDKPEKQVDGHFDHAGVKRWLVSCAGCGMCEQACPNHLPIAALFAYIRKQLGEQWEYVPGRSMEEALPVL